ncbi:unnamed protein product [Caenorhabditis nigoni]
MNLLLTALEKSMKYLTRIRLMRLQLFDDEPTSCDLILHLPNVIIVLPFPHCFYILLFPIVTIVNAIVSLILCPFIDLFYYLFKIDFKIKQKPLILIHFAEFPLIRFCTSPIQYFVKWTANREEDGSRDFWEYQSHDILYKYSENRTDVLKEFKEYYLYVKSLMSVEVDSVVWHMGDFNQLCRNNVDWLRSNGPEFPALSVHGSNQQQEELQYILDNLKFTKSLKIVASMIDSIENPLPLRIPDTLEELSIFHGPWITLDYIMSLKMRRLEFYHTYLTNENLNVFFKSWIEMKSHHNLERLEINLTNREDFIVIGLRDIPYRMGPMRPAP